MNGFSGVVRLVVIPAAAVVVVIGGAMGLSAAAHASSASEIAPAGRCVASSWTR